MPEADERERARVHAARVVRPAREHRVLDAPHQPLLRLRAAVDERVRRHVEEEEVLLLRRADALLDERLCEPLAHVAQLVVQLQRVPRLACAGRNQAGGRSADGGTSGGGRAGTAGGGGRGRPAGRTAGRGAHRAKQYVRYIAILENNNATLETDKANAISERTTN